MGLLAALLAMGHCGGATIVLVVFAGMLAVLYGIYRLGDAALDDGERTPTEPEKRRPRARASQ
jgi:uncharacterized membrane protein HdeD (DUF308 family)